MFEHRKDPSGIRDFKLAIEVHLTIDWVSEFMEPLPTSGVGEIRLNQKDVHGLQLGKCNPRAIEYGHGVEGAAV